MILTREDIQRMTNSTGIGGIGRGGDGGVGGGADMAGYATESWVDENYLSIAIFNRLFKAYNGGTEVLPNDGQTTIDNIRAMFGFWTEQYVSALGQNSGGGGGGGGTTLLEPLASINEAGLAAHPSASGQTIVWNGTAWVYGTAGGGDGTVTSVATGTGLSGGPITTSGTISINSTYQGYISHGESAYQWMQGNPLSGYATQSWVNQQGFITQANADNRYLKLTGGALTGNLTLNGTNLILNTSGSSSDDCGDILFNYGGGYEKARIWVDNTPSTLQGPNYRVYDSSGTLLGTTRLALLTDNVASATKLNTARTIWGHSFDGTYNISGNINNASSIEFNEIAADAGNGGFIDFHFNGSTADYTSRIIEDASGRLQIRAQLYIPSAKSIRIGDGLISWDADNNAIKITDYNDNAANLYAKGGISALGQGVSGSGSAVALYDLVDVSIPTTMTQSNNGQVLMYNHQQGKWINGNVTVGTVTSITAGTGLSGGTITGSGTISINSTYQDYISHGETAYGWGNHANAGYATQTWVGQQGFLTGATSFWGRTASNGVVNGSIEAGNNGGSINGFHSIDLNSHGSLSGYGGFIDFNFNGSAQDYTSRIIEDASGRIRLIASAGVRIGDAVLKWDSTNGALYIQKSDNTPANFYATGGVSALGFIAGTSSVDSMTFGNITINSTIYFSGTNRYISYGAGQGFRIETDGSPLYLYSNETYIDEDGWFITPGFSAIDVMIDDSLQVKYNNAWKTLNMARAIELGIFT